MADFNNGLRVADMVLKDKNDPIIDINTYASILEARASGNLDFLPNKQLVTRHRFSISDVLRITEANSPDHMGDVAIFLHYSYNRDVVSGALHLHLNYPSVIVPLLYNILEYVGVHENGSKKFKRSYRDFVDATHKDTHRHPAVTQTVISLLTTYRVYRSGNPFSEVSAVFNSDPEVAFLFNTGQISYTDFADSPKVPNEISDYLRRHISDTQHALVADYYRERIK